MLFVEYPKCATCQKARKWLETQGKTFTSRHIKDENPTEEELKLWWERSGFYLLSGLNQYSFTVADLVLDNLRCPASEALEATPETIYNDSILEVW